MIEVLFFNCDVEQRICEIEERLACKDLTVQEAEELRYEKELLEELLNDSNLTQRAKF